MEFECHSLDGISNPDHIEAICKEAIQSVDPYTGIHKKLKLVGNSLIADTHAFDLQQVGNIYVVGFGKASIPMAEAIEDVLGDRIKRGIVISKQLISNCLKRILCLRGNHPIPGKDSVNSTMQIVRMVEDLNSNDLVICLISGGGSALFTWPNDNIGLEGMQRITDFLVKSGASIQEINSVRKCIDRVKGGEFANIIKPAQLFSLILSDVLGDSPGMIASGPTVNEPEKILQGMRVMEKYRTTINESDEKLLHLVNEIISKDYYQTDDKDIHENMDIYHLIIGSLSIALKSAEESAKRLGYQTRIIAEDITGEAREIGRKLGKLLIKEAESKGESNPPVCLIAGGETTVTVTGNGKGGRNQELALGAAIEMDGYPNCILVALATDGEDSTTDAAGAIVTGKTLQNGMMKNLDPEIFLKNNDSYHYFEQAGGLIKTGPTGTNVNDMILMFVL